MLLYKKYKGKCGKNKPEYLRRYYSNEYRQRSNSGWLMSVKGKQSNGLTTTGGHASRSNINAVVMLSLLNFEFHSLHMQR
jgi:hypothetical protein